MLSQIGRRSSSRGIKSLYGNADQNKESGSERGGKGKEARVWLGKLPMLRGKSSMKLGLHCDWCFSSWVG